ncbi:MAG: dipeptidase PepE [Bacteroidales bacterium]|nr:dipeptidase PepE [Bacteroidales bacterium]
MKKLLLISNSTNFGENYLAWPMAEIELFLVGTGVKEALFIPYAGVSFSYDEYEKKVAGALSNIGLKINSVHKATDPVEAVKNASCIIIGGGNTFHLVHMMHKLKLMSAVREKALQGTPFIGWSAGSNIACPTLRTTNDMPIVQPESFDCLNLIPFQINPHYLDPAPTIDAMIKHGGETRDDRIKEFITLNQDITVVGLREACSLVVEGDSVKLKGGKPLRVLKYNQEPKEYPIGSDINFLMKL